MMQFHHYLTITLIFFAMLVLPVLFHAIKENKILNICEEESTAEANTDSAEFGDHTFSDHYGQRTF